MMTITTTIIIRLGDEKKNKYKQKQIKQTAAAAHNKVAAGRQMAVSAVVAGPVGRRP